MSIYKIPLPLNILEAARERITWTLNTLPRVCVSFSGGKDSGLMPHQAVIAGTFTPFTTGKWLISGPGMQIIKVSATHCIT